MFLYAINYLLFRLDKKRKKKTSDEEFIHVEKVEPFITRKEEHLLFKRILKEKILPTKEMEGISERALLKAREESIVQIKKTNVFKQII